MKSLPELYARMHERLQELLERDPEVRRSQFLPEVVAELRQLGHSIEILTGACERYADRPALGSITRCPAPELHTITYRTLWRRSLHSPPGIDSEFDASYN